jgi:hypothetical protein
MDELWIFHIGSCHENQKSDLPILVHILTMVHAESEENQTRNKKWVGAIFHEKLKNPKKGQL